MRSMVGGTICIVVLGLVATQGQVGTTTTANQNTNGAVLGNLPSQNLKTAPNRRPGLTVQQAIARHRGLIGDRVNDSRSGANNNRNSTNTSTTGTNTSTGTTNSAGGLGDLSSLLTLFGLGGSDLSGLLSTVLGGSSGTGTTTGDTASTDTSTQSGQVDLSNFTPANGTEFTLEDLIRLRDLTDGTTSAPRDASADGLDPSRAQTSTATSRPFRLRLADRLLSSTFAVINGTGFLRSRAVVDLFKNALRPLFPAADTSTNNGNGNTNANSNSSGSSNDGIDGSIDDVPAPGVDASWKMQRDVSPAPVARVGVHRLVA